MAATIAFTRMKKALNEQVIPILRKVGFKGSYPHFRRITEKKVDLISFMSPGIFGGGFEVGASVVFPNAVRAKDTNLFYRDDPTPPQKMVWAHGRIRCGLPGMFGGAFYYTDLYALHFSEHGNAFATCFPFSEKMAENGVNPTANGEVLVQKADEGIYDRVASEAARQIADLLNWFERMQTPADLQHYHQNRTKENLRFAP